MRKIVLLPISLLFSVVVLGQTTATETLNPRKTITELATESPKEHALVIEFAKTNGSFISVEPSKKGIQFDGTISLEKAQLIDPNRMGLAIPNQDQYYKIEGTDKMLVIYSVFTLQQLMKQTH